MSPKAGQRAHGEILEHVGNACGQSARRSLNASKFRRRAQLPHLGTLGINVPIDTPEMINDRRTIGSEKARRIKALFSVAYPAAQVQVDCFITGPTPSLGERTVLVPTIWLRKVA